MGGFGTGVGRSNPAISNSRSAGTYDSQGRLRRGGSIGSGTTRPPPQLQTRTQYTSQNGQQYAQQPRRRSRGGPSGGGGRGYGSQGTTIQAPRPGQRSSIRVTTERNPELDRLSNEQQENINNLRNNTGVASDAVATRVADSFEGARNARKYMGGSGVSSAGQQATREGQINDTALRANAGAQTDLLLGREQQITGAIQGQLGALNSQQQGMDAQTGRGLQAEGLRQNQQNNLFNQGLAGQRLGLDAARLNSQNDQWGQQFALDQYNQGGYDNGGGGYYGGGGWG